MFVIFLENSTKCVCFSWTAPRKTYKKPRCPNMRRQFNKRCSPTFLFLLTHQPKQDSSWQWSQFTWPRQYCKAYSVGVLLQRRISPQRGYGANSIPLQTWKISPASEWQHTRSSKFFRLSYAIQSYGLLVAGWFVFETGDR